MKGNEGLPEEEITLGDRTACSHSEQYCASGSQINGQCVVDHGAVSTYVGYECPSQYVEVNDRCYEYLDIQAVTRCTACFAGSYLSGGVCYECSEGYTSDGGSATSCYRNSCPPGQYLDSSHSTGCSDCPSSKYCTGGDAMPADCGEGYSPNAGNTGCVRTSCPAGQYLDSTAPNGCADCPSTKYCTGGTAMPADCSDGYSPNAGHTSCVRTSCPSGKYLDSSHSTGCADCPSSKYCTGGDAMPASCAEGYTPNGTHSGCVRSSCPAGQGVDPSATTGCSDCAVGYYSPANDAECHKCPDGYTSAAGSTSQTSCYMNVTAGNQLLANASSQVPCLDGYYNATATTKVNYGSAKECYKCVKGTSNADHTSCEGEACGIGKGKDTSNTTGCSNCAPGYYSPANDDECHKCPNGKFSAAGAGRCVDVSAPCCENPYGTPHTITELYGCQQAVASGATVTVGACPETINPRVSRVSASYAGTLYLNANEFNGEGEYRYGYKTVTYVAYDQNNNVISGDKLNWSVSGGEVVANSSQNSNGFLVTYKGLGCNKPSTTVSVTASGKNGVTGSATSSSITIVTKYDVWKQMPFGKKNTGNWPLISEAYATNNCYAVGGYDAATGTYAYKYNRCCGNGGDTPATYTYCCVANDGSDYKYYEDVNKRECPENYTIDEGKDANTCKLVKIPACYKDSEEEYHWTFDPEPSWVVVPEITKDTDCVKDEPDACYKDTTGAYHWGKYARTTGYTRITSVDSETLCHDPEPGEACYKDANNNYVWASSAPSGYTMVDGVTKPEDCAPAEPEACYLYNNQFIWGKYSKITGYIILEDIRTQEACKTPTNACYKDRNGNYVWGEYSGVAGYTLVPSITKANQCNNDVPTPSTGLDVTKTVYIFMAMLMAFGIGFIYYSSVMKKAKQ